MGSEVRDLLELPKMQEFKASEGRVREVVYYVSAASFSFVYGIHQTLHPKRWNVVSGSQRFRAVLLVASLLVIAWAVWFAVRGCFEIDLPYWWIPLGAAFLLPVINLVDYLWSIASPNRHVIFFEDGAFFLTVSIDGKKWNIQTLGANPLRKAGANHVFSCLKELVNSDLGDYWDRQGITVCASASNNYLADRYAQLGFSVIEGAHCGGASVLFDVPGMIQVERKPRVLEANKDIP